MGKKVMLYNKKILITDLKKKYPHRKITFKTSKRKETFMSTY
jgi:hypothetical protein